jgi:hypothetical protein
MRSGLLVDHGGGNERYLIMRIRNVDRGLHRVRVAVATFVEGTVPLLALLVQIIESGKLPAGPRLFEVINHHFISSRIRAGDREFFRIR